MQVSNDTESVIDTDTAGRGIAGIDYRVLGIAHHYHAMMLLAPPLMFGIRFGLLFFSAVLYRLFDVSPQVAKCKQNFILIYCSLCVLLSYFVAI